MSRVRILQIGGGILSILLGISLFTIHADQQFINLASSEGSQFLVPVLADHVYTQTFPVQGKMISKVGVFAVPINVNAKNSAGLLHLTLHSQDRTAQQSGDVAISHIDGEGFSFVTFDSPLQTAQGELVTLEVTISPDASRFVAFQKRSFDEAFSDHAISFAIDGQAQDLPIAYAVFERIWPPFMMQLGGILILAGLLILCWRSVLRYRLLWIGVAMLVFSFLYAIPGFESSYWIFFPLVTIGMFVSWFFFRITGRTMMAALFGACLFACSTWLPLLLITGGSSHDMLSVRDALIDPNQISVSHGAGGYVGIPGALLSSIGLGIWIVMLLRKRVTATQIDTCIAVVWIAAMFICFVPSPLQHSRAIILVVACIAYFASLAFDRIQRFLGTRDFFAQLLLATLFCIALLDLMHITAQTFAYGLGI